jgi:hypothetical protein
MDMLQNQKTLPPNPTLSIFMVRLILCDCSLCQHGFDIQINQNILEKLEAKSLYISRAGSNFYGPEIEIWAGF